MAQTNGERLVELVKQTKGGDADKTTLAEAKQILQTDRATAWSFGTPSLFFRQGLLRSLSHGSPVLQEALSENLNHLEDELGGKAASGAELLLVENVLTCWIWVQYVEGRMNALLEASHSMDEGRYWQETLDRAHGRFNRAVQSLASYRKVAINVQVNIAGQQINAQTVNTSAKD